ncbi:hypothetical protein [Nitrosococcus wardiae]|uniref:DUF5671 domain-containing protein n=1 Tax=Nitrosococcus wardiae TaxID=1814290 RepID=A0A4P7C1L4_9GAMM|nr:hypothetical protein [Nitrosococcus wardiae]QBQ55527.1 hypothetical protein E3U44_14175 [Nitrosococcus wardiae]
MANLFEGLGPPIGMEELVEKANPQGVEPVITENTPPPTTVDIIQYRYHKGFQNNLTNKIIDNIDTAPLANLTNRLDNKKALIKAHPEAYQAQMLECPKSLLPCEKPIGGVIGDTAEFVGNLTDPIIFLLIFLAVLSMRFVRRHKEVFMNRISNLGLAERFVIAGSVFWILLAIAFIFVFEPFGSSLNDTELMKAIKVTVFPPIVITTGYFLFYKWTMKKR